jgi:hypothetical protein
MLVKKVLSRNLRDHPPWRAREGSRGRQGLSCDAGSGSLPILASGRLSPGSPAGSWRARGEVLARKLNRGACGVWPAQTSARYRSPRHLRRQRGGVAGASAHQDRPMTPSSSNAPSSVGCAASGTAARCARSRSLQRKMPCAPAASARTLLPDRLEHLRTPEWRADCTPYTQPSCGAIWRESSSSRATRRRRACGDRGPKPIGVGSSPRRTRALPDRKSPFPRRFCPL